jgi:hypothetical protein
VHGTVHVFAFVFCFSVEIGKKCDILPMVPFIILSVLDCCSNSNSSYSYLVALSLQEEQTSVEASGSSQAQPQGYKGLSPEQTFNAE